MTRQELRVLQGEWFCGCGNPEDASAALLRLLRLHPMYEHWQEFSEWVPDDGIRWLLLYQLDRLELTEHGGNVGGAWLTDKGNAALEALAREEADGFETLCELSCIHGYTFDEDHDCMAAGSPSSEPGLSALSEDQIADLLVDSYEDVPEIQVRAHDIAATILKAARKDR